MSLVAIESGLQRLTARDLRALTPLAYSHVTLYGNFKTLAVHRYPRDTVDVDLAISSESRQLDSAQRLRASGYYVEVRAADAADPLGGVIDVRTSKGDVLVQVVNFSNPPAGGFPRLVVEALATSILLPESKGLRVVDLPHLIAFKLYAGGRKSELDILELIARDPELDIPRLRQLCEGYRPTAELEAALRP